MEGPYFNLNRVDIEKLSRYLEEPTENEIFDLNRAVDGILQERLAISQQIADLRSVYQQRRLVLVLGAGVSLEFGLPDWNSLLQKLLIKTFRGDLGKTKVISSLFTKIFDPNPLVAARYLSHFFEQPHDQPCAGTKFEEAVRDAMYEDCDILPNSAVLEKIANLIVNRSANIDSIVTYNYDDMLETYLENLGVKIPFRSIYAAGMAPSQDELPIYHVHGFLPRSGAITEKCKITLSEDLYHRQYSDIYSWANIIQINKFKDTICLFIGLSFRDPNLRRLMDIARLLRGDNSQYHYIIKKKYDAEDIKGKLTAILSQDPNLKSEKLLSNLSLSKTVEQLSELIEKFEEKDALSFGVRTIWIQEYREIPGILEKIRIGNDQASTHNI